MFAQTRKIIFGGLLSAIFFCAIMWNLVAHKYLIPWFLLFALLLSLRGVLYLAYLKNRKKHLDIRRWNAIYLLLVFFTSVTMGSASIIIHLTNETVYHFIAVLWVVGYSALAVTSYAMSFRAILVVFIPMLSMLIVSLVLAATTLHLLVAAAMIIWSLLVVNTIRPVNQSMIKAIALNHQLGLEIEKKEELEVQLRKLSITDSLTGLFNRRHFDFVFEDEFRRAKRSRTELSLAMIDIDSFKQFNDTYGHQAGDEGLFRISGIIRKTVNRPGDLVARYGGEEIVVLLPNTSSEQTFQLAERMRIRVRDLDISHRESMVPDTESLSISIGIATLQVDDSFDKANLLKKADDALYQAKANGRNQTVVCAV